MAAASGKHIHKAFMEQLQPYALLADVELVDIAQVVEDHHRILRIYIHREGGLDMATCEKFHRSVIDLFEDVSYDYLEVTSCGDRPLKTKRDYERLIGKKIEIRFYVPHEGKKRETGELVSCSPETIEIRCDDKKLRQYGYQEIAQAKPWYTF